MFVALPWGLKGFKGLRGLRGFKGLKGFRGPSRNRRPRPSGTPSNLEGDVHGAVHTISTTPPDLPFRRGGGLRGAVVGWHRKVGKRTDLPTTQNGPGPRLATTAAGRRLASTALSFLLFLPYKLLSPKLGEMARSAREVCWF